MRNTDTRQQKQWVLVFLAWLIALAATLGALFLGEVMGRTPCLLCWYQRIAMFPLVVVLGVGLLPFDPRGVRYALPLALVGGMIALYHYLLYWGVIPPSLVPCGQGVSCTDAKLGLLGFVSIPLLSLMAFASIIVLLLIAKRGSQNE